MRYRPEHKSKMKQKIIDEAASLFRRHGYDGVGIDKLMHSVQLTRGGFYGYFRSKAELFVSVISRKHDLTRRMQNRKGNTKKQLAEQALEVVAGYLNPSNVEKVAPSCALASLSIEVTRAGGKAKSAYTKNIQTLAMEFSRALPGNNTEDPRALAAIATCVGALIVARSVNNSKLAGNILDAGREVVERELRRRV